MKISRKFFKSKYLNKKRSVTPFFITTLLFCCILIILLQLLLFFKARETPAHGLYLGTLLTAAIMVVVTSLTFWQIKNSEPAPAGKLITDNRPHLIEDLQNENKYFSKVLSHDLRSPLSSIVLLASYLKTKPENSENNRYIELIEQSARKELDMMATLLSLMRIDSFKSENLQQLGLKGIVDTLIGEYETQFLQKQLRSSIMIPHELTIQTDPDSFTLVLKTLIHYALHYSDPGEALEIKSIGSPTHTEIVLGFISSQLKIEHPEELFRSKNLLKNGIRAFPENVDLYFCRKLISSYNGTVHVQATANTPAFHFVLSLQRQGSENTAI
jgi:signal transduction histidine kinase